jgi:hypothetical protein
MIEYIIDLNNKTNLFRKMFDQIKNVSLILFFERHSLQSLFGNVQTLHYHKRSVLKINIHGQVRVTERGSEREGVKNYKKSLHQNCSKE